MLTLGMVIAVVGACVAQAAVINNKMNLSKQCSFGSLDEQSSDWHRGVGPWRKYRNSNFLKQRKETIMMVLGMVFAVVVACLAEVGVVSNKMNWSK